MNLTNNGLAFIAKEEGLRLAAYQDQVGIWTIGYGSTYYETGTRVKAGDSITKERALLLFRNITRQFETGVNSVLKRELNVNQFDALVSISFNIGLAAFGRSSLLKRINNNPCEPTIRNAFLMWKLAGGKPILLNRRIREANLYFS